MHLSIRDTYLENEVLSADPVRLVQMLYRGAIANVQAARAHLASGDIRARANAVNKTCDILAELALSLDHQKGGDISRQLAELYAYMLRRLNHGNTTQTDAPFAECESLLADLLDAWQHCGSPSAPQPEPAATAMY